MIELWIIICMGGGCNESILPDLYETERKCMVAGNVEMHRTLRALAMEGIPAQVGWLCKPEKEGEPV
ncbi:hypothetical protein PVV74_11860 [Roseovarius sp. SK2]|uniref:hypothetical protein n=1 Tax=Roseovarius TaxID=74030 RepID=UPI00237B7D48|nr:hypothetical protein [Roseovarius sp. SK2]MDD9726153.1 hypothetical protein [Roseovarius sp. SK2]